MRVNPGKDCPLRRTEGVVLILVLWIAFGLVVLATWQSGAVSWTGA